MKNITFDSVRYETALEAGEPDNLIAIIGGMKYHIPHDSNNRHYAEIKKQVDAGELTIADAD